MTSQAVLRAASVGETGHLQPVAGSPHWGQVLSYPGNVASQSMTRHYITQCSCHGPGWFMKVFFDQLHATPSIL